MAVRMKWEEDEGHREAERGRDSMAVNSGAYSDFRDPKDQVTPVPQSRTRESRKPSSDQRASELHMRWGGFRGKS